LEKAPQGAKDAQATDKQHIDDLLDEALDGSSRDDSPAVGGSS